MKRISSILIIQLIALSVSAQVTITGTVRNAEDRDALPFVNVYIAGTTQGTTTDDNGNFSLSVPSTNGKLVASHLGFVNDTLAIRSGTNRYQILLKPEANTLQEVTVMSGTLREVSKMDSPIPVEIYSPAMFMKNPTPSIFESLSMINGVQPQLNCNVCNTGDIHINGMEGPYTMVLIDGMPIVSSLSTVYGLSGIPNSMVKRIEIVKGPASTLYGSEAVAGIINIITREPSTSPRFKTDVSATSYGEYNADVSSRFRIRKADALIGVNYFNFSNRFDINGDNFTDVTLQDRVSIFNKWNLQRTSLKPATLAVRYVHENRWGGELQWSRAYRGSDQVYGESIFTNRGELIGTYGLLTGKENITLDYSYNFHVQDSYYGTVPYLANQQVAFTQLRWEKLIRRHQLLVGVPFRTILYDDNTPGTRMPDGSNRPMNTYLPGVFIQDEWKFNPRFTWLNGFRYDHHNKHGNIFSPRVSLKYSPNKNSTFRLSSGNGFRVVNLFTEDHAALTGARQVIIKNELRPEQSWNVNLNYATQWGHKNGFVALDASVFYTYFTNKIIGDFQTDPDLILFDNLDGHAISKGVTLNTDFSFTNGFKAMIGATAMDVFRVENKNGVDVKTPQLFAPRVSGTYAFSYSLDRVGISFDLTGRFTGPMYLPVVPNDFRPEKSPWFTIVNLQATKVWSNGLEIYGGVKNLLNFLPIDPLLRPFDPFDKNVTVNNPNGYTFDTSYNYAPIQGVRGFLGVRYTIR